MQYILLAGLIFVPHLSAANVDMTTSILDVFTNKTSSSVDKTSEMVSVATDSSLSNLVTTDTLQTTDLSLEANSTSMELPHPDGDFNTTVKQKSFNFFEVFAAYPETKALYFFNYYFMLITSIPGMITNPLTIFLVAKLPKGTTELHVLVLGITDFVVVSLRLVIISLIRYSFRWTDASCKIFYYVVNVAYTFSNYILVSWTIERFIAVVFPFKLYTWRTLGKIKLVLLFFCVMCLGLGIPQITERSASPKGVCTYSKFYYETYANIETFVYMYIPIILIFGCNIMIVYKLNQRKKPGTVSSTDLEVVKRRPKEQKHVTITLVVVATAFFLLHLPQIIAKIWQAMYPNPTEILMYDTSSFLRFHLFMLIGYQITDFQNSINFFLYCASGSKFRAVLVKTFCGSRLKRQQSGSGVAITKEVTLE